MLNFLNLQAQKSKVNTQGHALIKGHIINNDKTFFKIVVDYIGDKEVKIIIDKNGFFSKAVKIQNSIHDIFFFQCATFKTRESRTYVSACR